MEIKCFLKFRPRHLQYFVECRGWLQFSVCKSLMPFIINNPGDSTFCQEIPAVKVFFERLIHRVSKGVSDHALNN